MTTLASSATVTRATPADVPEVARTFARAFRDDPFLRWLIRDDERLLRNYVVWLDRIWLPHGETLIAGGHAAASWLRPGEAHLGALEQLRLLPALSRAAGRDLPRLLFGLGTAENHQPREPHWYLPQLGVDPEAQGQGLGSLLLEAMLTRCDADGLPAYLEATTRDSIPLYERHGFEVTAERRLPMGGPPYWPMWREPR